VRLARRLVTNALNAWHLPGLCDDAALVVSELVTNTLDHADGSHIHVRICRTQEGGVRIAVEDRTHARPQVRRPDCSQERGRGVYLVDAVSARWGTDLLPWGKRVWAELRGNTREKAAP
jgi:two-component sensor histidine kinase